MIFLSIVCDVILQEQKEACDEIHQLPCLKRKFVHSDLLCIHSVDEKQSLQTQHMQLFVVIYESEVVLAREVLHGLQLFLQRTNKIS